MFFRQTKVFFLVCFGVLFMGCTHGQTSTDKRPLREVSTTEALHFLSVGMTDMDSFRMEQLKPLLIERISGTSGNTKVREHIKSQMTKLGWKVEEDFFQDDTPFGRKPFVNVIATHNPGQPKRTIVACHYDSKDMETNDHKIFIGAMDSAVPCSIMLETAKQLDCLLRRGPEEKSAASDLTLQFVFFDGEEAFEHWSSKDSIYGARHLAKEWEDASRITSIRELILLDLIGTTDTQMASLSPSTASLFKNLAQIEKNLRSKNMLSEKHTHTIFTDQSRYGGIEDDHIPFIRRGVDVLHLISVPFPQVWHKITDDERHLDFGLIDNFSRIFRVFISGLLHLRPENIGCRK